MNWRTNYIIPSEVKHKGKYFFGTAYVQAAIWKEHRHPEEDGRFGLSPKSIKIVPIRQSFFQNKHEAKKRLKVWIVRYSEGLQYLILPEREPFKLIFDLEDRYANKVIATINGKKVTGTISSHYQKGMTFKIENGEQMTITGDSDWASRKFKHLDERELYSPYS